MGHSGQGSVEKTILVPMLFQHSLKTNIRCKTHLLTNLITLFVSEYCERGRFFTSAHTVLHKNSSHISDEDGKKILLQIQMLLQNTSLLLLDSTLIVKH